MGWRQGANCGGGYGQVADMDGGNGILIGDMWGIFRTSDGGRMWRAASRGSPNIPTGRAVALSRRPATEGWAFIGIGPSHGVTPGTGYFGVSSPDGALRSVETTPRGFGLNIDSANAQQPRPAGRIIVVNYDQSSDTEYVYAFAPGGVTRYVNDAQHHPATGSLGPVRLSTLTDCFKAAVLVDPDTILAATFAKDPNGRTQTPKVYRFTGIRSSRAQVTLVKADTNIAVNGFRWVRGVLYAACTKGLYRVNTPTNWTKVGSFDRIVTDVAGDDDYLYVGQADPALNMPTGHAVARSADDGKTWTWAATKALSTLFGTQQEKWWLSATYPNGAISGKGMDVQELAVDEGILYAFGRKGCWASPDQGQTWYPAVRGIGGSVVNNLFVSGSSVNAADVDWVASASGDNMRTCAKAQAVNYPAASLSRSVGGHTYRVIEGVPCDITKDGNSIADDLFRSWAVKGNVEDLAISSNGTVYVGSSGGGLLVYDP